jgi:CubicO group peptidase (beta-lactamase class C family)
MNRTHARILLAALACWTLAAVPAAHAQQSAAKKKHSKKPAAAATPAPQPSLGDFDDFVAAQMKQWKVPGVAIAVVQEGKIILLKGYGLRDVKDNLPVTPKTLFAIGSITKSFTVSVLGMLVDEGKLDWDKPVRDQMPDFRMEDEMATDRMTPKDLVTHRSGLPRHDLLWYNSTLARDELVGRLRYLQPNKDLRYLFQYNNLMFLTAGVLEQHVTGMRWEDLVRQRIFGPLGMTGSNFSVTDSQKTPDFAKPYQNAKDTVVEIPFRGIDEIAPAGAINSNAEDMVRYLLFHMNHGQADGKPLLSRANSDMMRTPQMVIPGVLQFPESGFTSYGMGFFITTYRGHIAVSHGGAIDGFTALLAFLPRDNIGVVILTNLSADKNPLPNILYLNVADRLLGLSQIPWSERIAEQLKKGEEAEKEAKQKGYTAPRPGTHPSHDLAEYVGDYENPGYGVLRIDPGKQPGELQITYNRITAPLGHFHYDVFQAPEDPLDPFEEMKVRFITGVDGNIESISVPFEPAVKEIVFTRRAGKEMRQKSFLEPFTGVYQIGRQAITVALRGEDTLTLTVPGQPVYELVPREGTTFDLKGISGFSAEFRKDESGAWNELVLHQPNGTFVAKRAK